MALLPLPALPSECAPTHSPRLISWGALSSCKLFLHKPIRSRNRGHKLAIIASFTEAHKHPRQRPSHSPKRFPESSSSKSSSNVGSPSSWKQPSHKKSSKYGSTRYRPFSRQDSYRGGRGSYWEVEDGESFVDSSSGSLSQGTAMARIVEKLRDIQRTFDSSAQDQSLSSKHNAEAESGRMLRTLPTSTAGELFLPKPNENLFSIGNYWSTPDHPIPAPGRGALETRFGWDFEGSAQQEEEEKKKRVKPPTLAELLIPPDQLRRLRTLGIALTNPVRVGRLGITDNIADKIIGQWRSRELVKVQCGGPAAVNMMKIHKDLERKTGGLVVWRAGSVAVVYRGSDYDEFKKTSTSLEKKLDGFLSEGNKLQKLSLTAKQVDATNALSELSEVRADSNPQAGGLELQCDVMPNDVRKEETIDLLATFSENILNVSSTGISPYTGEVKGTQEMVLSPQLDANSLVEQPTESGNEETASEPKFNRQKLSQKLNIAPDPFVDRDYEIEIDNILESLGPRCQNWTGATPVPIDADLLPPLIPNYRPPYRLLPYGIRPQLTNNEQTDLRRLVRHVTPHFVLGRNKGQQGLAAAILKLWEKTEVVKIAVKSGVQNTSSEKMAEELKRCTGGVILARDRYFITLYRGKDFLPQQLAFALTERTTMLRNLTKEDETVEGGISTINPSGESMMKHKEERAKVNAEAEKVRRRALAKQLEEKLALALEKKVMAEKDLEMLEAFPTLVEQPADKETTTTVEEKYMFRRVGLKMKPFLLVGRRGVFKGVVENMHLHWKHRELVKLITKEKDRAQVQKMARILEKESGGVLITVEGTSKGQAIIIYRGKNYVRPENLRPLNLLDNKKALERSLEVQRRESLSRQISILEREINKLKSSLSDADKEKEDVLDAALDKLSTSSDSKEKGVVEDEPLGTHALIQDVAEEELFSQAVCSNKKELLELVKLGPIYRATRLSNLERLKLRKLALKLFVTARFHVGKGNVLLGLARAIRIHFLKHPFAVVTIKNRGRGTSSQDLVHELEDLTGGVLISHEQKEILLYRGWPKGEKMPISGAVENVSPELVAALEEDKEDDWDTDDCSSHMHDNVEGDGDDEDDEVDSDPSVMAEAIDIYENAGYEEHLSMTNDLSDDDDEEDYWNMPVTSDAFDNDNVNGEALSMTEDVSDDDETRLSMLFVDASGTDAEEGYSGTESLDVCGKSTGIDGEVIDYVQ